MLLRPSLAPLVALCCLAAHWSVSVCAELASWSLSAAAPPAPGWDEGLHYGALVSSRAEWALYFNSSDPGGVLHVWTACRAAADGTRALRLYTATESGDLQGTAVSAAPLRRWAWVE